jgi:predicted AlkP superfamily pyrophosphatase or phosphodiesterase
MKKILIIGMDGLQMSQVDDKNMPNVSKFKSNGFSFENHHASFPTVTRTNVSTIVTGVNPGTHGILGNNMVFPEYDKNQVLNVMYPEMKNIYLSGNKIVLTPTLSDIASENNLDLMVLNSGTSGNALIQNTGVLNNKHHTFHRDISSQNKLNHDWPKPEIPDLNSNTHMINILEKLEPERFADISIIWFDEPDKSQHNFGIDSIESIKAINHVDNLFKNILDLINQNDFDPYIFLISDHGYSKISKTINLTNELATNFPGYLFAENGGSFMVYAKENQIFDPILINEIISKPWAGPMILGNSNINYSGIHNYDLFFKSGVRNPDLFVSMNWKELNNSNNIKGEIFSTNLKAGNGNHGSISPQEINNTLILNGPDINKGNGTELPSGNVDVLPTILYFLNIALPSYIEGRVLKESFTEKISEDYDVLKIPLTSKTPSGEYMQEIQMSLYNNYKYLDYGYVEK